MKNFDLEDQFEALDKTIASMFNVFVHSQKGDSKMVLLDVLEALEKVLYEENKHNEDLLVKGDDSLKKELFKEILEKSADGITLQDWIKETLEQVITYFTKNDIESFFKKDFRKDSSVKSNESFI